MRLIIKPAGIVVLIVAILALAGLAFFHHSGSGGGSSPAAVTTAVTPIGGGGAAAAGTSAAPAHTQESELLAAPEMASSSWELLQPQSGADVHVYASDSVPNLPDFPKAADGKPKLRRVQVLNLPTHPWDLQLKQTIPSAIATGTHLRLRVWARSKDRCPITVVCEHNATPYEKLVSRDFTLSPDWQQYEIEWTADQNTPAKWAQVGIQLAAKVGQIDLAGASLRASTPAP